MAKLTEIWEMLPCQKEKRHNYPAPFPEQLAQNCILGCSDENDIVLDPYMGSGTVVVVAKQLNRKFIGIEINPDYIKTTYSRLRQKTLF